MRDAMDMGKRKKVGHMRTPQMEMLPEKVEVKNIISMKVLQSFTHSWRPCWERFYKLPTLQVM